MDYAGRKMQEDIQKAPRATRPDICAKLCNRDNSSISLKLEGSAAAQQLRRCPRRAEGQSLERGPVICSPPRDPTIRPPLFERYSGSVDRPT